MQLRQTAPFLRRQPHCRVAKLKLRNRFAKTTSSKNHRTGTTKIASTKTVKASQAGRYFYFSGRPGLDSFRLAAVGCLSGVMVFYVQEIARKRL